MSEKKSEFFMDQALSLACRGQGTTSPNPMVGAVLVKQGRVIAKGYHVRPGGDHAEIIALKKAGRRAKGATLYVTLEPCCHLRKRTPPCVNSLLEYGVKKVVVGSLDPNPRVSGRGIAWLKKNGILVQVGVLEEQCNHLNSFYQKWIRTKQPFVILKVAMTLDGKVATAKGESKWITHMDARKKVHHLRKKVDGVMVGYGTLQKDNPELSVRLGAKCHQPKPILLDPEGLISTKAKALRSGAIWVVGSSVLKSKRKKTEQLAKSNITVLPAPLKGNCVELKALLKQLGHMGITSILVEGGPILHTEFMKQGLFDQLWVFIAPKLLGSEGRNVLGPLGVQKLEDHYKLKFMAVEVLSDNLLILYSKK